MFLFQYGIVLTLVLLALVTGSILAFVFRSKVSKQQFNPLYSSGLFHCYMLDESICHFRGVGSVLSLFFYF